jgi:hypothetical protein
MPVLFQDAPIIEQVLFSFKDARDFDPRYSFLTKMKLRLKKLKAQIMLMKGKLRGEL